jgi:hypothetical protein
VKIFFINHLLFRPLSVFVMLFGFAACASGGKQKASLAETPVAQSITQPAGSAVDSSSSSDDDGSGDRDSDGTLDRDDMCPDVKGGAGGCPDSDSDGSLDGADACPEVKGQFNGCPSTEQGNSCVAVAQNMMTTDRADANDEIIAAHAAIVKEIKDTCESQHWSEQLRMVLRRSFSRGIEVTGESEADNRAMAAFRPRFYVLLGNYVDAVTRFRK